MFTLHYMCVDLYSILCLFPLLRPLLRWLRWQLHQASIVKRQIMNFMCYIFKVSREKFTVYNITYVESFWCTSMWMISSFSTLYPYGYVWPVWKSAYIVSYLLSLNFSICKLKVDEPINNQPIFVTTQGNKTPDLFWFQVHLF